MCGIVGYLGHRQATEVLVEGLSKLEYRGYDSAGVAVNTGNELEIRKFKGRLAILAEDLEKSPIVGGLGIGHTRWATHGEPSDVNSHPHFNMDRTIAVVHNGIIENYMELKEELQAEGVVFLSQTDTEIADLVQLVSRAARKKVHITTDCVCDLPQDILEMYGISAHTIIPTLSHKS